MKRFLSLANGRRALRVASALTLLGVTTTAFGADHRDGDTVKLAANIASDINDVYAFPAGDQLVLGMTVFPVADENSKFDTATVYVLHVDKHAAFLGPSNGSAEVLCTFNAEDAISCWVTDSTGTLDYVTGDASAETGLESVNGRFKVFAGLRTDPFYFNLDGFNAARTAVYNAVDQGVVNAFNGNGCPIINAATGAALRSALVATDQAQDFFATLDTLAIVIEADPTLFTDATNQVASVYGSTHTAN